MALQAHPEGMVQQVHLDHFAQHRAATVDLPMLMGPAVENSAVMPQAEILTSPAETAML